MSCLEKNLYLKRKGTVRKGTALSIQEAMTYTHYIMLKYSNIDR